MAGPACQNHPDVPASFLATFLASGDTVAVCDECLVPFTAAILNTLTGVDPAPFLAAVSDDTSPDPSGNGGDPSTAAEEPPEGKPPAAARGRSGRTSAGSPAAGTDDAPEDATTATPAQTEPPAA